MKGSPIGTMYCRLIVLIACSCFFRPDAPAQANSASYVFMVSKVPAVQLLRQELYVDSSFTKTTSNFRTAFSVKEDFVKKSGYRVFRQVAWMDVVLVNTSSDPQKIVLALPSMDSIFIDLHYALSNSDSSKLTGKMFYNPNHFISLQRRSAEIFIPAKDTLTLIIRLVPLKNRTALLWLKAEVLTMEDFFSAVALWSYAERRSTNSALVFLSLLFFQLLFISLQGVFMKRIEYLYYLCYAFSVGVYYLARFEADLNWSIFFTYFPAYSSKVNDVLLFLPFFFYYRFARHFCEIQNISPGLKTKIKLAEKCIVGYCSLLILHQIFPFPASVYMVLLFSGLLLLLLTSVYFLIKVYQLRSTLAKILVVGSLMALVTTFVANLATFVPVLFEILPVAPLQLTMIGVVAEMTVFNAGLVFKARQIEREQRLIQEQLLRETEERRQLVLQYIEERDRIAADLHDDIGATLSSIGIYSASAAQKLRLGDQERSLKLLEQIGKNAIATMNNMSDIVWAINPVNDNNQRLMDKMESFATILLQARNMAFHFDVEHFNPQNDIPPGIRKCIYLIFKEAINNSVKYAHATMVRVRLEASSDAWNMVISDDGIGFDTGLAGQGNGLRNMQNRAQEANGRLHLQSDASGTRIVLNIPK